MASDPYHILPPGGVMLKLWYASVLYLNETEYNSQHCDNSVFITAWLNGIDRNLNSVILTEYQRKMAKQINKIRNTIPTIHLNMYNFDK